MTTPSFDVAATERALAAAVRDAGGVGLVFGVLDGVPGVTRTPARRGLLRSQPERVQVGSWRYEPQPDGLVRAAHVVGGVVLAETTLGAGTVAPHLTRALVEVVEAYGERALARLEAVVEVLAAGRG
jgi:hypothetical protein